MRGSRILMALGLAAALAASGCGQEAPPPVTQPPEPADVVPWPETLAWAQGVLPPRPVGPLVTEHMAAVAADASGFVAVGFHEIGPQRDGAIWFSDDGHEWTTVGDRAALAGADLVDVAAGIGGFVAVGTTLAAGGPTTVIYHSEGGERWERLAIPGAVEAYASSVAGGPSGYVVSGNAADGGPATWMSADGRSWDRLGPDALGEGGLGVLDAQAVADGWVALAADGQPPVLLRSRDGLAWTATVIEDTPDAYADRLVAGRWGLIARGGHGSCNPFSSCPSTPVTWWSGSGDRWIRLPPESDPTPGAVLVAAGAHGLVQVDGTTAQWSSTGWSWEPLPEPGDGTSIVNAAVVRGDVIVAVGETYEPEGGTTGWVIVAE